MPASGTPELPPDGAREEDAMGIPGHVAALAPALALALALALAPSCSREASQAPADGAGASAGDAASAGPGEPAASAASESAAGPAPAPPEEMPLLLDRLGDRRRPVTTSSPEADAYFQQGLALVYAFNHEAAVDAFTRATELDPGCALCFWGIGLALGPNINAPMGPEANEQAHAAAQEALRLVEQGGHTPLEEGLVRALAERYAAEPPEDRSTLDLAYAEAMQAVQEQHPADDDVAVLTAEALMDLRPWDYWTAEGEPREHTAALVELLETVLARDPSHLGANHYYIHAVEKFEPEKAVPSAERLAGLAPIAGHLVHMPSHIFWRVGRYDDALEINQRAAAADEVFFATCRPGAFYRAVYYPHNLHFLWAAAAAEGRSDLATSTARKLEAETRAGMDEFPFLEEFQSIPMVSLARFGRWDAILGQSEPPAGRPYLVGIWHYTRGLAHARKGDFAEAEAELEALRRVQADPVTRQLLLAGGTATAAELLAIGAAQLEGEIAAERGRVEPAVASLERAVALQDALPYMEPPPWYFPTRQALGAVLLAAGRPAEAEAVYRADLERHPGNGWSLFGLAESLAAQGREAEAGWARKGFANAWSRADLELDASRY